jgi:spore germination cell wall hydrolase CwlJ-like protein
VKLVSDVTWGIITLWMEGRGETHVGKVAIAEVILNRTKAKYSSDGTIAGTCLRAFQFSSWNTTDTNRLVGAKLDDTDSVVQLCIKAWEEAVLNLTTGKATVPGALLYYNPRIPAPAWVANSDFIATVDHHSFYKPKF